MSFGLAGGLGGVNDEEEEEGGGPGGGEKAEGEGGTGEMGAVMLEECRE